MKDAVLYNMNEQYIPKNLKARVEKELQPGEQVERLYMPVPSYFTSGTVVVFLVGVLWITFVTLWIIGCARQEDSFAFSLFWGFPFMVIGLVFLSAPIWSYRRALKTVYVITDKRAITIKAGWSSTTRSYTPDILKNIYIKVKKDGTGDVIISLRDSRGRANGKETEEFGFFQVRNPEEVEKKLKNFQNKANEPES